MKVFHHNDLDGYASGAVVAKYRNNYNEEDFFEVDYVMTLPLEKVANKEEVWFVDYSFTEKTKYVSGAYCIFTNAPKKQMVIMANKYIVLSE